MSTTSNRLAKLFRELEKLVEPCKEYKVFSYVKTWRESQNDLSENEKQIVESEEIAFCLDGENRNRKKRDTYFNPGLIPNVTPKIINHWMKRAKDAKNPVLKARYADFVWDFSKPVLGTRKAKDAFAKTAIDSYLEIIKKQRFTTDTALIGYIKRALELSIITNDKSKVVEVRDSFFDLFAKIADIRRRDSWAFLFDNLYNHKKVKLESVQEDKIIKILENVLSISSNIQYKACFHQEAAREAGIRLKKHYLKIGRRDDVTRVVRAYGKAYEEFSKIVDPLSAMMHLSVAYNAYHNEGLKEDAKRVQLASKVKGKEAKSFMEMTEIEPSISDMQIEQLLAWLTGAGLETSLYRIACYFTPQKALALKQLERNSKEFIFSSLVSTIMMSEDQISAQVGTYPSDLKGNLVRHISYDFSSSVPFLRMALDRIREHYDLSIDELISQLNKSPIFNVEDMRLIKHGIEAYCSGDFISSIHILIPQVEHILRRILNGLGEPTNKATRSGVMQEKNMDDILTEEKMKTFLGEDISIYLRVLFSDQRGWNLRNRLSHGLMPYEAFNRANADRVIHVLLTLALFLPIEEQVD